MFQLTGMSAPQTNTTATRMQFARIFLTEGLSRVLVKTVIMETETIVGLPPMVSLIKFEISSVFKIIVFLVDFLPHIDSWMILYYFRKRALQYME